MPTGVNALDLLTLIYDAHGSTRALALTNASTNAQLIAGQAYLYDAYGNMLTGTPGSNANLATAATTLTALLYSGESTDPTGKQYLRARYYDVVPDKPRHLFHFKQKRCG